MQDTKYRWDNSHSVFIVMLILPRSNPENLFFSHKAKPKISDSKFSHLHAPCNKIFLKKRSNEP